MKPLRLSFLGFTLLAPASLSAACSKVTYENGHGDGPHDAAPWHTHLTGAQDQAVTATTVGADGHVILCGASQGWADLGSGFASGKGTQDLFVSSFAADGTLVFAKRFSGGTVACNGVVTDAAGDIFLTGAYSVAPLSLGGALPADPTLQRAFVAKMDAAGKVLWSRQVGAPYSNASSGAIALRPDGAIVLAGIDEDGLFVMDVSAEGEVQSTVIAGAMEPGWWPGSGVQALAIDPGGDLFVAGNYSGYASLGALQENGVYDRGFVTRLTSAGAPVWAVAFGDPGNAHFNTGATLQIDAAGDVVVGGYAAPDYVPGKESDGKSLFVEKLRGGDGEVAWKQELGAFAQGAYAALDSAGDVVFVTWQSAPSTVGGTKVPAGTFLVNLTDAGGDILRVRPVPELGAPQTLALGPKDEVVLTATFEAEMGTSFGLIESGGGMDVFAVGLGPW